MFTEEIAVDKKATLFIYHKHAVRAVWLEGATWAPGCPVPIQNVFNTQDTSSLMPGPQSVVLVCTPHTQRQTDKDVLHRC